MIIKLLKTLFLFPYYIRQINRKVDDLTNSFRAFRKLYDMDQAKAPVVIPTKFQPQHPTNLIRLGSTYDGGYLIPLSTVKAARVLVSYGVQLDWAFEEQFSKLGNTEVFAYDKSTEQLLASTTDTTRESFRRFFDGKSATYFAKFIGNGKDGTVSVEETLRAHHPKPVFLKFDIEGAEYIPEVWRSLANLPQNVIGVAAEFHDFPSRAEEIHALVQANGFKIVHLHVNNAGGISSNLQPRLVELTLVRPEYFSPSGEKRLYPLEIDSPCITGPFDVRVIFAD